MILDWTPHTLYPPNYAGASTQETAEFAAKVLIAPVFTASSVFNPKQTCITLRWSSGTFKKEAVLHVAAKDAPAIVAALETVTGKPVQEYAQERAALQETLKKWVENAPIVSLDRESWIGGARLRPGQYSIVLFHQERASAEVYIVPAHSSSVGEIKATFPAQIAEKISAPSAGTVIYEETGGLSIIRGIYAGDKQIQPLPALPLIPPMNVRVHRGAISLRVRRYDRADSWVEHVSFEGEPALRFPVSHRSFFGACGGYCDGFLYLTPHRLVYVPKDASNPGHFAFDLRREEVKDVSRGTVRGFSRIYHFSPLYSGPDDADTGLGIEPRGVPDFWDFFLLSYHHFDEVEREFQILAGGLAGQSSPPGPTP